MTNHFPSRVLAFILCAAMILWAQQQFSSPATILPGANNTTPAELRFRDLTGHYVGLKAQTPIASSLSFKLPKIDGSSGQCWGWSSALTLGWVSCSTASQPTALYDGSGHVVVNAQGFTGPVDYWNFTTDGSGDHTVTVAPDGSDTNIDANITSKGTGKLVLQSPNAANRLETSNAGGNKIVGGLSFDGKAFMNTSGFMSTYGNVPTQGFGVGPIYFDSGLVTNQTASVTVNLTVGGAMAPAGTYRISGAVGCDALAGSQADLYPVISYSDNMAAGGVFVVGVSGSSHLICGTANAGGAILLPLPPSVIHSDGTQQITFQANAFGAGWGTAKYHYAVSLERLN